MIRTKDIWEKQNELKNLQTKAQSLEEQIKANLNDLEDSDTDFEYAMMDAHITGDEKRLESLQTEIKEKEYELKVMKGEVEATKPKHWEVQRSEVKLMEFGIEA